VMWCHFVGGIQPEVYLARPETDGSSSPTPGRGESFQIARVDGANKGTYSFVS